MLIDIVSKNGNLLLNFPQHADGTLDQEAENILADLAAWMPVNGEGIYATRPWIIYGEGPTKLGKGRFGGLNDTGNYKSSDIRFTQSKDGKTLYAFALGWPDDRQLVVRSLASAAGRINSVTLLGHIGKLDWQQTDDGLVVKLPAQKPCAHAVALKISAGDLKPVPVVYDNNIRPGADRSLTLTPAAAELHGAKIRVEHKHDHDYIAAWDKPEEWASWTISVPAKATYNLSIACSAAGREVNVEAEVAGQKLSGTVKRTTGWYDYQTLNLGKVELPAAGKFVLNLRAQDATKWKAVNIRSIKLTKVE